MAAYTDDFSAAGTVENLMYWWETLYKLGPKFEYYPEASKSWLIVKPRSMTKATHTFNTTDIKIIESGKRHLGAVIGSTTYRDTYVSDKVN